MFHTVCGKINSKRVYPYLEIPFCPALVMEKEEPSLEDSMGYLIKKYKRSVMDYKNDRKAIIQPVMGVSRLYMGTDGEGVTTLVTFYGCPLRCKYCINPS